jgi:uncharacterized membrane protein
MTVTDFATFVISVYFLGRGASRGFINSLLFPFSIIAATILSAVYFKITGDVIISLLIGLIGPFLLCIILKIIFKMWVQAVNIDIAQPGFISRLAGAALTLLWGWVFIIFALILLAVAPPWGETLTAAHNDAVKSASYQFIAKPLQEVLFTASKENIAAVPGGSLLRDDARSLSEDPRFQKVLQDPDIQKEIEAHDIAKLMSNPKMMDLVQQIMSDPGTMKKVMALYTSQASSGTGNPSK